MDSIYTLMLSKLKQHVPEELLVQIDACIVQFDMFDINSPLRMAHFLGQCHYESAGFKIVKENLNYSAEALKKVFGKYFSDIDPELYAHQPEKIAARVYANRMGNGDEASKEGFKYLGRGYIQLTGKDNYIEFGEFIKDAEVVNDPELLCTKYSLASAGWYWVKNKISIIADGGINDETIVTITKVIDGGTNGLEERKKYCNQYYQLLA